MFTRTHCADHAFQRHSRNPRLSVSPLARIGAPLAAALMLAGCAGSGLELATLSAADTPADATSTTAPAGAPIETGSLPPVGEKQHAATEPEISSPAIVKARKLRDNGDLQGARSALAAAAANAPKDRTILREQGLLALEMGQIDDAKKLLTKADDADKPDWRVKSALGSAYAASGDQKAAQREFAAALKLAPDHPSILNNMALSHALDGRHAEAEKLLRRAAQSKQAAAKANQNLALILGLQGNIDEARQVSQANLSKEEASANISYLEKLRSSARVSRSKPRESEDSDGSASTTAMGSSNAN